MRKRYFFFDIDGTLAAGPIAHRYVPESTQYAVDQLRANGHFVAIATGRGQALARPYMEKLGFNDMVSDGGNGVVLNGELLGIEPLPREGCIRVLEECEEKGVPWAFAPYDGKDRLTRNPGFAKLTHDSYMNTIVDPDLDFHAAQEFYKIFLPITEEEEALIESLKHVPTARFSPYVLFVEPVDKSAGIKRVMDYYGAPYEDVVVFGDGANDLSMFFPEEWTCIAMGNAVDELKARASYVTADADKDGILLACRHFGWVD